MQTVDAASHSLLQSLVVGDVSTPNELQQRASLHRAATAAANNLATLVAAIANLLSRVHAATSLHAVAGTILVALVVVVVCALSNASAAFADATRHVAAANIDARFAIQVELIVAIVFSSSLITFHTTDAAVHAADDADASTTDNSATVVAI